MTTASTPVPIDAPPTVAPVRASAETRMTIAVTVAAAMVAFALYRPWEARPFDILDFSEFLPLLTGSDSAWGRFAGFLRYYFLEQGRANIVAYVALTLKWSLFGDHSTLWQLSRVVLMLLIIGASYLLLRRLGASRAGAASGAMLFVVANTAAEAWTRQTMGEPMGLALTLLAAHLAVGYQASRSWRRDAVVLGIALMLALSAKETFVATVPFLVLLGVCRRADGTMRRPRIGARELWLGGAIVAAGVVALIPVAIAALGATSDSYTAAYGTTSLEPRWYLELLGRLLLLEPLLFPGNLALAVIVALGWIPSLLGRGDRRAWWMLAVALSLPLAAAAVYFPWPRFEHFYGLPFLLAPALLVALAITHLERASRGLAGLGYALALVAVAYHGANAVQGAREMVARQRVNAEVAHSIATATGADSILVAMPYLVRQSWQGNGPTLRRYALAVTGTATLPPASDVLCADAARRYKQGLERAMLITYSDRCGSLPRASTTVRERYSYLDWTTFRVVHDSLRADIFLPGAAPR